VNNKTPRENEKRIMTMTKSLSQFEQKIEQLKKKKEALQSKQALQLLKEAQKILGEEFTPELALVVLADSWKSANDSKRKEWTSSTYSFRKVTSTYNKTNPKSVAANS